MSLRFAYQLVLHKHGELLYTGVTETIRKHLSPKAADVACAAEDALLPRLRDLWDAHVREMRLIRDVLMYMDRTKTARFPVAAIMPSQEPLYYNPPNRPFYPSITKVLGPFMENNAQAFQCPSDSVYFRRLPGSKVLADMQTQLASIPLSAQPDEYKNLEIEGTSYEYPQRRLTELSQGQLRGKTREQAVTYRGQTGATSKLWVLYEFEAFHAGMSFFAASDENDYNDPDPNRPPPQEGARNFLYLDGHVENL
jgi:prepilin-type processing-associated H-X9-DG protein